jgi:hypothetical protein
VTASNLSEKGSRRTRILRSTLTDREEQANTNALANWSRGPMPFQYAIDWPNRKSQANCSVIWVSL